MCKSCNKNSCNTCCVVGPRGPRGFLGPTGSQGATGSQGLDGATGPTGAQGLDGATGAQGVDGATGPTGAQGLDGVTGPTGSQGPTGNTIPTGFAAKTVPGAQYSSITTSVVFSSLLPSPPYFNLGGYDNIGVYTVPVAGYYNINTNVALDIAANTSADIYLTYNELSIQSTQVIVGTNLLAPSSTYYTQSINLWLDTTDTISVELNVESGTVTVQQGNFSILKIA